MRRETFSKESGDLPDPVVPREACLQTLLRSSQPASCRKNPQKVSDERFTARERIHHLGETTYVGKRKKKIALPGFHERRERY